MMNANRTANTDTFSVLVPGSNPALKPTRILRAAYFRALEIKEPHATNPLVHFGNSGFILSLYFRPVSQWRRAVEWFKLQGHLWPCALNKKHFRRGRRECCRCCALEYRRRGFTCFSMALAAQLVIRGFVAHISNLSVKRTPQSCALGFPPLRSGAAYLQLQGLPHLCKRNPS